MIRVDGYEISGGGGCCFSMHQIDTTCLYQYLIATTGAMAALADLVMEKGTEKRALSTII